MLAAMDRCFGLIRPHQRGIANTQAQGSDKKESSDDKVRHLRDVAKIIMT